jgi:hypothetical protein
VGRPETYPANFKAEVRATFASVAKLLAGVDLGLDDVARCAVYLTDLADFAEMDAVFRDISPANPLARGQLSVSPGWLVTAGWKSRSSRPGRRPNACGPYIEIVQPLRSTTSRTISVRCSLGVSLPGC